MRLTIGVLVLAVLLASAPSASSDELPTRRPVELPPDAKAIFMAQMLGHVVSLDAIVTAIAEGDFDAAAGVARQEMGVPREGGDDAAQSADDVLGPGLGLGEYLPDDFKAIGVRFHEAANRFAEVAAGMPAEPSTADHRALIGALAGITHQCRDCHDQFTVQ